MESATIHKTNVLLGVTGSVAAIKTLELVAKLQGAGYSVRVMCTENALHFFDTTQLDVPLFRDVDEWSSWTRRGDPVLHIEVSVCGMTLFETIAIQFAYHSIDRALRGAFLLAFSSVLSDCGQ
ncbi:unnamed protein product [Echinostoma caproni]|uniref:Flavoprotein domain-containing protein n=1 Tax=Echinostoma caproni TaxID=27848 RepID=A0A183AKS9_9TREM|nr:unnamed protein product [Echinostoma caproni]